jgi:hypothetical protein
VFPVSTRAVARSRNNQHPFGVTTTRLEEVEGLGDLRILTADGNGSAAESSATASFPRLRLRQGASELLGLSWELPLARWHEDGFREMQVGPSRHLVRFLATDGRLFALKEEPLETAQREFAALRHLEELGLPAVSTIGLAEAPDRDTAILVTEYLANSLQYRRLLMRFPVGPGSYRDRLLDAMAWLLIDLHRAGVYWGDCSLANTLFRRDGDKIQAYLVDAETSEVHPSLSDGQRRNDLDILVENVAFGLADLAAYQGRPEDLDAAIEAAESVRERYELLWDKLHETPELRPHDRHAIEKRIRKLNDLGFSVDEVALEPGAPDGLVRLTLAVTTRLFHARHLERKTGIVAMENQARLLLNDLHEYAAWLEWFEGRPLGTSGPERWLRDVFRPTTQRLAEVVGPGGDIVQAYCDLLEHKWLMSEQAGRDVGLEAAIESYLALGAPAPERPGGNEESPVSAPAAS